MTELGEWQVEIGGVRIGSGTPVLVRTIEGMGLAPTRDADVEVPGGDGVWPGPDRYGARTLRIDAGVRTPSDPGAAMDLLAALQEVADRAEVRLQAGAVEELRLRWPGRPTRVVFGRLRVVDPDVTQAVHGWVPADVQFVATEPRWFGDEVHAVSVPLARRWPAGFRAPVVAPVVVALESAEVLPPAYVHNAGTAEAWPWMRLNGPAPGGEPLIDPVVELSTGQVLELDGEIAPGDWVQIDCRPGRRSVVRANGGSVETALSWRSHPERCALPPGLTEVRWSARAQSPGAELQVWWRDTYVAL